MIENLQESIIIFSGKHLQNVNNMFLDQFGQMIHDHFEGSEANDEKFEK